MRPLALLALALLAGCGTRPTGLAAALPGSTWLVDRIVESDGSVLRGTGETVSFGADGQISLASCNRCGGSYSVSAAGVLTLGEDLTCTQRSCDSYLTELQGYIQGSLQMSRDGEYLVLTGTTTERQIILLPETAPAETAPTATAPN